MRLLFLILALVSLCESGEQKRCKYERGIDHCAKVQGERMTKDFHKTANCNQEKTPLVPLYYEGDQCLLVCKAGYLESSNHPECTPTAPKSKFLRWEPSPTCTPQYCGTDQLPGFPVYAYVDSTTGSIPIYFVKYDRENNIPIYSAALHDSLNYNPGKVDRSTGYSLHPCERLKYHQRNPSNGHNSRDWQVGHLTPYHAIAGLNNPAAEATSLYVNLALQESYTNMGPWSDIESWVLETLQESGVDALVITGVCPGGNGRANPSIPSPCFWKLVCFFNFGGVQVVGFVASNTLTSSKGQKIHRKLQSFQFRTQRSVLNRAQITDAEAMDMWRVSHAALNRPGAIIPEASQCHGSIESDMDPPVDGVLSQA